MQVSQQSELSPAAWSGETGEGGAWLHGGPSLPPSLPLPPFFLLPSRKWGNTEYAEWDPTCPAPSLTFGTSDRPRKDGHANMTFIRQQIHLIREHPRPNGAPIHYDSTTQCEKLIPVTTIFPKFAAAIDH